MEKKPNYRLFWYPFICLLVTFIALTIALESGYYETKISQKVTLTAEKIAEFEKDVANGQAVDIKDYLNSEYVDYSSKASDMGVKISHNIEGFMTKGISKVFRFLGTLVG